MAAQKVRHTHRRAWAHARGPSSEALLHQRHSCPCCAPGVVNPQLGPHRHCDGRGLGVHRNHGPWRVLGLHKYVGLRLTALPAAIRPLAGLPLFPHAGSRVEAML